MDGFQSQIVTIFFGMLIGIAATLAYCRKQLLTDPLTSLPNQKAVPKYLRQSLRRVRRDKTPLSIALVDLDNFKAVNTEFGYTSADHLLAEFAEILRDFSRSYRIRVLRYRSGDEFLLIMERTEESRACEIVETLQETLQKKTFRFQGKPLQIRLSAGIATFTGVADPSEVGVSIQNLIDTCEKDLFAAKSKRALSGE